MAAKSVLEALKEDLGKKRRKAKEASKEASSMLPPRVVQSPTAQYNTGTMGKAVYKR